VGFKLELVLIPVSDVDPAKTYYSTSSKPVAIRT
jgi:hypothetical protein